MEHAQNHDHRFDDLLPLLPRLRQQDPQARDELARALLRRLPDLVRPQFHSRFPELRSLMQTDDIARR